MRTFALLFLFNLLVAAPPAAALTLDEATSAALSNHQQIAQFRANADRSQAEIGSARAAFLPSVDLDYAYSKQDRDPWSFGTETSLLALSASLNLFNGLADQHRYQAAKHRAAGADYRLRGVRADVILATKVAYIEVLRAERSIETEREGVELLERQRRDAALRFKHGVIARNDLLRVEVELSSARQDLLRATGNYRTTRRRLERITGLILAAQEKLQESSDPEQFLFNPEFADSYRREMQEKRSELNYLRQLVAAAKRERSARRGNYLPALDIKAVHEEYGDDLSPSGRDNSYDEDNILLLNASWNLFDGFADRSSIAAADATVRAVAAELRDTEAVLLLQLETALNEADIARGQLDEARTGVVQAEENYRVTENRYQQQQATTVDLLDAQFLLTRSRNLQVDARYNLYLTSAALERILERAPLD